MTISIAPFLLTAGLALSIASLPSLAAPKSERPGNPHSEHGAELHLSGPAPLLPELLRACLGALDNSPVQSPALASSAPNAMLLRRLWQRLESELTRQLLPPGDPVTLSECRREGLALRAGRSGALRLLR